MMMPRSHPGGEIDKAEANRVRRDISFRVSWSQAILFGCYEITVSFLLVIVSMLYYEKAADPQALLAMVSSTPKNLFVTTTTTEEPTTTLNPPATNASSVNSTTTTTTTTTTAKPHTLCGSLFPTWQSAAWLVAFYALVYLSVMAANIFFIRHTKKKVASKVSLSFILTQPLGRLLLGILSFFITCAFAAPVDEQHGTINQYINRISMHVTKTAMVVDAGFCIFFIVAVVKLETDWLKLGTNFYTTRQLIFIQLKFAVLVCFLSAHI